MKNLTLIPILAFAICVSSAQTHVLTPGKRVTIPATRVSIVPAPNYDLIESSPPALVGDYRTTLVVSDLSDPLDSVLTQRTNPYYLSALNSTLLSKSSGPEIDGWPSIRLVIQHEEGILVKQTTYHEAYLAGDSSGTLLLIASYPDTAGDSLKSGLLGMLSTIHWDRKKSLSPMELLRFSFEPRGEFAFAEEANGEMLYTLAGRNVDSIDAEPMFMVKAFPNSLAGAPEIAQKQAVDGLLRLAAPFAPSPQVMELNKITLDGINGYETVSSTGITPDESVPLIYLTTLFHPSGTIAFVGYAYQKNLDSDIATFKAMTRTFSRRKIRASNTDCARLMGAELYKEADDCFSTVLRSDPGSLEALLGHAHALRFQKRHAEAIAVYDTVLREEPDAEDALMGRGKSLLASKEEKKAIDDFGAVMRMNVNNVEAIACRASAKYAYGNLPGAAADYELAITKSPRPGSLHLEYAEVKLDQLEYQAAIDAATQFIESDSTDWRGYALRGKVYAKLVSFSNANRDLTAALRLRPQETDLCLERGKVRIALGQLENALSDFTAMAKTHPRDVEAIMLRARMRFLLGDHKGANEDVDLARKLDKSASLLERGLAYMLDGKYKDAVPDIRASLSEFMLSAVGRILLYAAEFRAYGADLATEHLRKYRKLSPLYGKTVEMVAIDLVLEETSEQNFLAVARSAVDSEAGLQRKAFPYELSESYFAIGMVHYAIGRKSIARKYWEMCMALNDDVSRLSQFLRVYYPRVSKK